eukprot:GHVT01076520.1.p3 GENE.GHVT01076520.1~~GHVT01076520.1.p3  ORF type:complete len:123 (-),score=1.01 GHVT01076520.1:90-458(-)
MVFTSWGVMGQLPEFTLLSSDGENPLSSLLPRGSACLSPLLQSTRPCPTGPPGCSSGGSPPPPYSSGRRVRRLRSYALGVAPECCKASLAPESCKASPAPGYSVSAPGRPSYAPRPSPRLRY